MNEAKKEIIAKSNGYVVFDFFKGCIINVSGMDRKV
jgi:hypothetical protein